MRLIRVSPKAALAGLAILFVVLPNALVFGQETGGGSTENFKRPANPSVHHRRQVPGEAAGGHTTEPAAIKQNNRGTQSAEPSMAGIEPGAATPPGAEPSPPSSSTSSARKGRLGSFGNLKQPAPAKSAPANPKPPLGIVAMPTPAEIDEVLENAIEAGNAARDQKPPDYTAAEGAYKQAAKLAPGDARPYEGLGNIYLEQGLNQQAIESYRKALNLDAGNAGVLESLGDAHYRLGQYAESVAASTEAIRLNPKVPGPYFTRTHANLTLRNGEAAGNDAAAFLELWRPQWAGSPPYYIAIAGYVGFRQARLNVKADKLLAEATKNCVEANWVCRLVKYLNREVTADQLLLEANDKDKLTEAHTYIGIDLAILGRRDEALPHLLWVKENGNKRFTEYPLAVAWLTVLESQ